MAGESAERQETGLVDAIKKAIRTNKNRPITVDAGGVKISEVVGARKHTGRQATGSEPYTDVILDLRTKKSINLSLKGQSAPSLAGGGVKGLDLLIPGITSKFMNAAYDKLIEMGTKAGDKVPDIYGQIEPRLKKKIVIGNHAMGGPIDYMYIGPMTVSSTYDKEKNILTLNGKLTDAKTFADTHNLYFRLRARREDQRFDPDAKSAGVPKIYGKSPSKGDSAGRVVITDSVPKNAVIVSVE